MIHRWFAFLAAITGFTANAQVLDCRNITVHVQDSQVPGPVYAAYAEKEAGKMLATAGVHVTWTTARPDHSTDRCGPPIVVRFIIDGQSVKNPNAFAYSLPFNPNVSEITVFWNKLRTISDRHLCPLGNLLAHVLAHETTHILQAIENHSDTGLMRPWWTAEDYFQMLRGHLQFTERDIQLMQAGIEHRAAAAIEHMVASNSAASQAQIHLDAESR